MRKLKSLILSLPHPILKRIYHVYDYYAYPELRECCKSYGEKNPSIIFYVIRPITHSNEGVMSLLMNVCRHILYAEKKGYVPIVDFKNYETQYSDGNKTNIWEDYFEQISQYTLDEVYASKNVVLSGLRPIRELTFEPEVRFSHDQIELARQIVKKYIIIKPEIEKMVSKELNRIGMPLIGLYLRGTDYISTKPIGHYIQPSLRDVKSEIDALISKCPESKVFLVTEDEKNYIESKEAFREKLVIASFDTFIHSYKNNELLFESESLNQISESKYIRGLNYLVKIIILSRCKSIIGGNTCGSWAAVAFSSDDVTVNISDLGKY